MYIFVHLHLWLFTIFRCFNISFSQYLVLFYPIMSKKEKEFLIEFIELYKTFPCLWKIKSREYSDRNAKSQAYEILVEKMRSVDESANRETVVKKINSMRTTYRKELKKVLDSERSGTGTDDVHVPHLWYYELLSFLKDQETPRNTKSNMDEESESQVKLCNLFLCFITIY